MSLAYALPFFCDALLYYGALGCLGLLGACRPEVAWAPAILLAGCWLSGRLTGRGRPWLRWLPMAATVPAMAATGNWAGALATLPMAVYLPLYVYNSRRVPDYDYAADRFRHSLIVAGAALFFAALLRAETWKKGLPYLFLYFTLNMALLRLLRHDDRVARSRRFRVLNLAGVALVCAAGFGLSQPGIVAALRAAWQWFLINVVLNVLALAAYAFQWVLYGLAWLMALLVPNLGASPGAMPLPPFANDPNALVPRDAAQVQALPLWAQWALKGAGIALLAALAFVILRAMSRWAARAQADTGTDERESLDANAPREPRGVRRRRSPEDGVRHWYRKALALIRARGGKVAPNMNTLQIQQANAETVDYGAMDALREAYLPVRYGGRAATRADVERAKAAYERLKRL